MSTMIFDRNNRMSSSQNTRLINIRYFFIKGRMKDGNINVVYCPTEMMVADYFTKSLQGSLFRTLRNVIMGVTFPNSLTHITPALVKENVAENVKIIYCRT